MFPSSSSQLAASCRICSLLSGPLKLSSAFFLLASPPMSHCVSIISPLLKLLTFVVAHILLASLLLAFRCLLTLYPFSPRPFQVVPLRTSRLAPFYHGILVGFSPCLLIFASYQCPSSIEISVSFVVRFLSLPHVHSNSPFTSSLYPGLHIDSTLYAHHQFFLISVACKSSDKFCSLSSRTINLTSRRIAETCGFSCARSFYRRVQTREEMRMSWRRNEGTLKNKSTSARARTSHKPCPSLSFSLLLCRLPPPPLPPFSALCYLYLSVSVCLAVFLSLCVCLCPFLLSLVPLVPLLLCPSLCSCADFPLPLPSSLPRFPLCSSQSPSALTDKCRSYTNFLVVSQSICLRSQNG